MGIKGLHGQLATRDVELGSLRGKRLAIDGHGWLHRACCGCAEEVAEGSVTERYADYVVDRVAALARAGIRCVLVFDGDRAPIKAKTNEERRRRRERCLRKAREVADLVAKNDDTDDGLRDLQRRCYAGALEVTREMVVTTIRKVRDEVDEARKKSSSSNFQRERYQREAAILAECRCLVAPYESDAQLAALCVVGACDGILSEDSDVVAYLAAAEADFLVASKWVDSRISVFRFGHGPRSTANKSSVFGKQLRIFGDFNRSAPSLPEEKKPERKSETEFREEEGGEKKKKSRSAGRMFVQCCVLAGCDYVENVANVGVVTAAKAVADAWSLDDDERLATVVGRLGKKFHVPDVYMDQVAAAELAFYFAPVFDGLDNAACVPFCSLFQTKNAPAVDDDDDDGKKKKKLLEVLGAPVKPEDRQVFFLEEKKTGGKGQLTLAASLGVRIRTKKDAGHPLAAAVNAPQEWNVAGLHPDHVCQETLGELPPEVRAEVQRHIALARRSIRDVSSRNNTLPRDEKDDAAVPPSLKRKTPSSTAAAAGAAAHMKKKNKKKTSTTTTKTTTKTAVPGRNESTLTAAKKTLFHYFLKGERQRQQRRTKDAPQQEYPAAAAAAAAVIDLT